MTNKLVYLSITSICHAESYGELWSTEPDKFDTPYIVAVDADFDIFNPDVYFYLLDNLKDDPRYKGASSSYSAAAFTYDTYFHKILFLMNETITGFAFTR